MLMFCLLLDTISALSNHMLYLLQDGKSSYCHQCRFKSLILHHIAINKQLLIWIVRGFPASILLRIYINIINVLFGPVFYISSGEAY